MSDVELYMVREDLDELPVYPLPAGFSIRWHRLGDEQTWVGLQAPFYDPGAITVETFHKWFGTDIEAHAKRIAYLIDPAGKPIGTAAAWTFDGFRGPEWGRVHWVAIVGEYQGRGLSKPLLSVILKRLVELGHAAGYLTTSRDRQIAVGLYHCFGFVELA